MTEMRHRASIADLPNLGPKSQQMLARVGITTLAELRALEGALTGLPWRTVACQHRTSLLLALDEHERSV